MKDRIAGCSVTMAAVFFLLFSVGTAWAQSDIETHPACPHCGMDRAKFAHSRILVEYDDGTVLGACSLHCVAVDLAVNIDKGPVSIRVGDYMTHELLDAEQAVWVIGGDLMGVMSRRAKWAFGDEDAASAYMKDHGGQMAGFEDAVKASYEDLYQDTRMIREKRKMKRMKNQQKGS